jgi:Fe-Mn family superoxide dismutase
VQGSGWGWLGLNTATQKLQIATCANQDPLSITGLVPLLGIDVWEHAYYLQVSNTPLCFPSSHFARALLHCFFYRHLQYKNVRPDYLGAIWEVVNWSNVQERFDGAK